MSHLLPSVARVLVPTLIAAVAVGISAPHAFAEAYGDGSGSGSETFVVGTQPKAGLQPIAPASTTYELLTRITSRRLAGNGPHARHCSAECPTGTT
jgi:hypothetical protein